MTGFARRQRLPDRPQSVRALRLTWYRDTAGLRLEPSYRADVPEGWLMVSPQRDTGLRDWAGRPMLAGWMWMASWVSPVSDVDPFLNMNASRARLAMIAAEQFVMRWRDLQERSWGGRVVNGPAPGPFIAGASRPRAITLMDDDDD